LILLNKNHKKEKGFSLLETLVALFLLAIALLAIAQLFILGILNNAQSDVMTNANFLAQQQIDFLRNLDLNNLNNLMANSPITEDLDINGDNRADYRRVTDISLFQGQSAQFLIRVRIFSTLNPMGDPNRPKVDLRTIISR
jgi:prepilin-type N-terminal cleavage/methylation domain-containing protein